MPKTGFLLAQPEVSIANLMGLIPEQVNIFLHAVTQEEVDLHFGAYALMLAEKVGALNGRAVAACRKRTLARARKRPARMGPARETLTDPRVLGSELRERTKP
ncbi:hypothetical protein CBA19CS91_32770 [Paraburkholderia hospita]|nr:hypothetical protein CBA19CS91_32770 [Paraburkholderia hospita]